MTLPLVLLAIGTCVVGLLGIPHVLSGTHPIFAHWLHPVLHETEVVGSIPLELGLMGLSIMVAGTGIFIAFLRYAGATPASEPVTAAWWDVLRNKWFLDEWIDAILIKPLLYLSNMFFKTVVEDELVTGSMVTSARAYSGLAGMLRTLQTGIVRHYALMMLVGISLLALLLSARLPGAGGGH
jgi:NADH-quinone oxidoreductase subunit L